MGLDATVSHIEARLYTFPTTTDGVPMPETDGTAEWSRTTVLVLRLTAGCMRGLGYAYASPGALAVVRDLLAPVVMDAAARRRTAVFWGMARAVRNAGWAGVAAGAVSAMDMAVHDLHARLLGVHVTDLLGAARERVMAYGSGGFTNYSERQLRAQLEDWVARGCRAVKIKVGSDPAQDPARVRSARAAIGPDVQLFVDANGAYDRKQALHLAGVFAGEADVTWFEEPVSSDDVAGLRLLRDRAPARMRITAGEYAYTPAAFAPLLRAVDTVQADATRCGGVTGFLSAAAQCTAAGVPLSAHTAPALHATLGCIAQPVVHVESFHDHELIEAELFDGVAKVVDGDLAPDRRAPGFGLALRADADPYLSGRWCSAG